jgi:hypothetical protein
MKDRVATSDWLIGAAVRFEYGDNGKSNLCFVFKKKGKIILQLININQYHRMP